MTHMPARLRRIAALVAASVWAVGLTVAAPAQGTTIIAGSAAAAEPVADAMATTAEAAEDAEETVAIAPDAPEANVAQDDDPFIWVNSADVSLDDFLWERRPVVVFADSPSDPALIDQVRYLRNSWPELESRDVVVIVDASPDSRSAVRQRLRPRGFSLVVMDKDGAVAQRKPFPWDGREVVRSIDRMPMRRDEIRGIRN